MYEYIYIRQVSKFDKEIINNMIPYFATQQKDFTFCGCGSLMQKCSGQPYSFECKKCGNVKCLQCSQVHVKSFDCTILFGMRCFCCKILIIKEVGCNHITCVCGAHWCYRCGVEFTAATIYKHMSAMRHNVGAVIVINWLEYIILFVYNYLCDSCNSFSIKF